MARTLITGRAQGVSNSAQRVTELRKAHPEWDTPPSPKSLARERLKSPKPPGVRVEQP